MFKNEYQGGAVVEVFSAQGKDPVAKWKLSGQSSISRMFDKEMKGFVYSLEGSSQTHRMQLPKDGKMPLFLTQKFLVLQLNVPYGKDFSTDLVVTDQGHLKRRLYLSTVHKEFSSTPLHARIPLTCLRRNIWCNMCIDLSSFTAELFHGAAFLSLDGIVISACCKVRRIFTMRTEPKDHVDRDPYDISDYPKEEIPKSCQFPPDIQHITQLMNMERLRASDRRSVSISSESGTLNEETRRRRNTSKRESLLSNTEQLSTRRATRGSKTHVCSHIAFGSKVTGRPPLTGRRSSSLTAGTEPSTHSGDERGHEKLKAPKPTEQAPSERTGSGRPKQNLNVGKERIDTCQPCSSYPPEPILGSSECQSTFYSPPELHILESETNATGKTSTPLSLEEAEEEDCEEVFTFSSGYYSDKRSQPFKVAFESFSSELTTDDLRWEGERKEACLEDDFVGSEGEEDQGFFGFPSHRFAAHTSPVPPTLASDPIPRSNALPGFYSEPAKASNVTHTSTQPFSEGSRRTEIVCVAPTRCLSPCTAKLQSRAEHSRPEQSRPARAIRTSINRTSVREIPLEDVKLHKVRESMRSMPVGTCDLSWRAEQKRNEEEELRMLVSIKRQQEEEEGDSGLSDSQVQECNVSLSMSSHNTSTWTQCIPLTPKQGQYYQRETNPLLQSNPRKIIDVFSPPVTHPRHLQTECKGDYSKLSTRDATLMLLNSGSVAEENICEDEFLSLIYDSCLNCYFDPQTEKYYELI